MGSTAFKPVSRDGAHIPAYHGDLHIPDAKGAVIVCHGFGEHTRLYKRLVDEFNAAGYVAVVYDQRGHGKYTEKNGAPCFKRQGVINDYRSVYDDFDAVAHTVHTLFPNLPICLYGHSMGGNIAVNCLLRQGAHECACVILESPWLDLHKAAKPGALTLRMVKPLGRLSRGIAKVNRLDFAQICDDPATQADMAQDEVYHNRMSMRLLSGILDGCAYAMANAAKLHTPLYMAYAAHEVIVCNDAIETFVKACPSVTAKRYDSCHAVHNCLCREGLFADMTAFLDAHCGVKTEAVQT
jgi:alpha-beta hydrolase superfamily lysophospholipase